MQTGEKAVSPDEVRVVAERLARAYPYIEARKRAEGVLDEPPLDSLVRAILSQHTSDVNRDRAFHALRVRYPDWADVVAAPVGELAETIHQSNHAYTKAGRIQSILRQVVEEHGAYSLDALRDWPTDRVLDALRAMHGVGEKTAAIVALFALKRPVMPVDTHVYRVTQRLGWVGPRVSEARAHAVLRALLPPDLVLSLHMGLWEHGRVTCRPVPRCVQCAIYACCMYSAKTAPEPDLEAAIARAAGGQGRKAA